MGFTLSAAAGSLPSGTVARRTLPFSPATLAPAPRARRPREDLPSYRPRSLSSTPSRAA
jgi:hypothetical protein